MAVFVLCLLWSLYPVHVGAQNRQETRSEATGAPGRAGQEGTKEEQKGEKAEKEEEEKEGAEFEFVASDIFRSASYTQPLVRRLNFEGHYFGTEEANVGTVGPSWSFRAGRHVTLSPGFGFLFGSGVRSGPDFTFRLSVEAGRFVVQGLFV